MKDFGNPEAYPLSRSLQFEMVSVINAFECSRTAMINNQMALSETVSAVCRAIFRANGSISSAPGSLAEGRTSLVRI